MTVRSQLSRKWGYPEHPDGPVPPITLAAFLMGCFTSLGGLCYGYNVGLISGLLEMQNFLEAFGELNAEGKPYFTNIRTGLIVGLVS
jgi:SP family sugar:H+ symporter-like MFS transporter